LIHIALQGTQAPTDFKSWDRETLERFAREAADENRQLRDDLRTALDAWHKLVKETAKL